MPNFINPSNQAQLPDTQYTFYLKQQMKLGILGWLLVHLIFHQAASIMPDYALFGGYLEIDHDDLMGQVSERLNNTYLGEYTGNIQNTYKGGFFAYHYRAMISLPIKSLSQKCPMFNVVFKVEPGAGLTTISKDTIIQLFKKCRDHRFIEDDAHEIMIAGRRMTVYESRSLFKEINILGSDFLGLTKAKLQMNYTNYKVVNIQLTLQDSFQSKLQEKEEEEM